MAGGPLQAADDMARILANGFTFNGADKIATALGEQDSAAKTAAARQRAGIAANVADAASWIGGGRAILAGGAKAIPALVSGAKYAVTHPKAIAGALGLGAGTALSYNKDHPSNNPAAVPAAAQPKPAAKAASAAKQAAAQVSPWEAIMGAVAKQQGGKISLDQLGAIADFTNKISPEIRHPPTYKDAAAEQLSGMAQQRWMMAQQHAKELQAKGDMEGARSVLLQGMDQASRDYGTILGQDPQNMLFAQRMQELNQGN